MHRCEIQHVPMFFGLRLGSGQIIFASTMLLAQLRFIARAGKVRVHCRQSSDLEMSRGQTYKGLLCDAIICFKPPLKQSPVLDPMCHPANSIVVLIY